MTSELEPFLSSGLIGDWPAGLDAGTIAQLAGCC